jgi:hypothetical protein
MKALNWEERLERVANCSYYELSPQEFKVGLKCQRRIIGEYDTDYFYGGSDPEAIRVWNQELMLLDDETGFMWVDHILVQDDIDFWKNYYSDSVPTIYRGIK